MTFTEFFIVIGVFIFMMVAYRMADRYVKKLSPRTVKTVNWIGFTIGIAGGIAWYAFNNPVYMFMTFLGIVIYFLFYGYDTAEKAEKKEG